MEDAKRIADEPIYLAEDRYRKPKELFKTIGDLIERANLSRGGSLLDAGCATGELIYYLRERLPEISSFTGIDISAPMIARAAEIVTDAEFRVGSLTEAGDFSERAFDVVTCSGVLSCFDDPQPALANLLASTRPGGGIFVYSPFNEDPIDVTMRYKRADSDAVDPPWETGWNIFSRHTIERIVTESGYDATLTWHPFEMPFDLEKKAEDPMRTWTSTLESGEKQLVNGACQIINGQVLEIRVTEIPD